MTYENYRDYDAIEPFELPEPFLPIEPEPPRPVFLPPVNDPEVLRVLAVGSRPVVDRFVHLLHCASIAHSAEWTPLIPTPNPGEFMRMLTKRIPLQSDDVSSR
ncbi:hypothetical protein H6F67_14545 [Microcoleus sp. FACHB-1515]|uniref:hypothetical protein n=1 Tax=Cyanophyceae TaxID=3028117 RepID=UPI00168A3A7E|nr:hypothetical protein [Microcoleus sp. FACHB-1515]MBD2091070.1 hypothetical protein [Microcoleus sp. FACHB-1515]